MNTEIEEQKAQNQVEQQEPPPQEGAEQGGPQEPGQELVKREPKPPLVTGERGYIVPRDLDEAYRYAVGVVAAGLAPNSYDNDPKKIMLGIVSALEAGLPPMAGLRNIAIINGRPTIWGEAAMGLAAPLIKRIEKREIGSGFDPSAPREDWPDDYGFHVSIWRKGQETPWTGEFTIGDAKKAGIWSKRNSPWITYPKRMLEIRARTFALRDGFSDALMGLFIREEVEDYREDEAESPRTEARRALLTDDTPDEAPEETAPTPDAPEEPQEGEGGGEPEQPGLV